MKQASTAPHGFYAAANPLAPVAAWVFICCALVFAMVILGGVTRLTNSGLSMVNWRPIAGLLPPLDEATWRAAFEDYKAYPEYQRLNFGMSLAEFKSIYLMEYIHRLWGRTIGFVFAIPFVVFLVSGRLRGAPAWRLSIAFALGGLQGLMGWYMVKSGLDQEPWVSAYRLTAHLGLAMAIYALLFWVGLDLVVRTPATGAPRAPDRARRMALLPILLVSLTMLSGGFVAGLDAGLAYNTFPLMDGRWVPETYIVVDPIWRNFFENVAAVQFNHRVLAIATLALLLLYAAFAWHAAATPTARRTLVCMTIFIAAQGGLGVATLLAAVPVTLGVAHQAMAFLVLSAALWHAHARLRGV